MGQVWREENKFDTTPERTWIDSKSICLRGWRGGQKSNRHEKKILSVTMAEHQLWLDQTLVKQRILKPLFVKEKKASFKNDGGMCLENKHSQFALKFVRSKQTHCFYHVYAVFIHCGYFGDNSGLIVRNFCNR